MKTNVYSLVELNHVNTGRSDIRGVSHTQSTVLISKDSSNHRKKALQKQFLTENVFPGSQMDIWNGLFFNLHTGGHNYVRV